MTDFPDWQAPQAHATSIAATGVPLLTKSTVVYSNSTLSVAGGVSFLSSVLATPQPGYEMQIQAKVGASATIPFCQITLFWIDSASGTTISEDTWIQPMSSTSPGWQVSARGLSKGDQVQIVVNNLDPSQTATLFVKLLSNSRLYPADVLLNTPISGTNGSVPGWTVPPPSVLPEVLAAVSDTVIPASGSKTWLIPPGSGVPAWISVHTGASVLTSVRTNLYPVPSSVFGNDPPLIPGLPPAADFSQEFIVPRAPMSLTIANTATTAITSSWSMIEAV